MENSINQNLEVAQCFKFQNSLNGRVCEAKIADDKVSNIISAVATNSSECKGSDFGGFTNIVERKANLISEISKVVVPKTITGKNANNTMVTTLVPNNEAEQQLYCVLQRASLLSYFDTLLEMGGDDVQQLWEAGEDEFLEIMSLVGMAAKPLHVRRLQKVLHEWATNPSSFRIPIGQELNENFVCQIPLDQSFSSKNFNILSDNAEFSSSVSSSSLQNTPKLNKLVSSYYSQTPILTTAQKLKIAQKAEQYAFQIPEKEPKKSNYKKRMSKELERVIQITEADPKRLDEIRKYSAIYGRFDCKRRPEKPLTQHEVFINEAAAQICKLVPSLLNRRDELFPLARQIVKEANLGNPIFKPKQERKEDDVLNNSKRIRLISSERKLSIDEVNPTKMIEH